MHCAQNLRNAHELRTIEILKVSATFMGNPQSLQLSIHADFFIPQTDAKRIDIPNPVSETGGGLHSF